MLPDLKSKIIQLFKDAKVDSILILNSPEADPNFFYFTRMEKSEFQQSILILEKSSMTMMVPRMEYELAKAQGKKSGVDVIPFRGMEEMKEVIKKKAKGKRIGLNFSKLTVNGLKMMKGILKNKKFIDISSNLAIIRRTKTKEEIKRINNACRIASKVIKNLSIVKIGMKERELAAEIDRRMRIYGADGVAFPTIVAAGKNSANPHYTAGDTIIKKGEFVLVDFGCKFGNYCSDVTRTFVIGTKSNKQKEMLETCKLMQKEIISMLKPGVKLEDLQKKANSISEKKYGKMLHWFGHSLGIEVHDPSGKAEKLVEGMVLTIEPAIYLPGFGGVRIEDDVLITKTGYKILTKN